MLFDKDTLDKLWISAKIKYILQNAANIDLDRVYKNNTLGTDVVCDFGISGHSESIALENDSGQPLDPSEHPLDYRIIDNYLSNPKNISFGFKITADYNPTTIICTPNDRLRSAETITPYPGIDRNQAPHPAVIYFDPFKKREAFLNAVNSICPFTIFLDENIYRQADAFSKSQVKYHEPEDCRDPYQVMGSGFFKFVTMAKDPHLDAASPSTDHEEDIDFYDNWHSKTPRLDPHNLIDELEQRESLLVKNPLMVFQLKSMVDSLHDTDQESVIKSDSFFGFGGAQALGFSALYGYLKCPPPERMDYLDSLTPEGRAYYGAVSAENMLVKEIQEPLPLIEALLERNAQSEAECQETSEEEALENFYREEEPSHQRKRRRFS